MEIKITVEDITKLKIEPTDIVICTVPEPMPRNENVRLFESLRRVCRMSLDRTPGIIILPANFDIKTMNRTELRNLQKAVNRLLKDSG